MSLEEGLDPIQTHGRAGTVESGIASARCAKWGKGGRRSMGIFMALLKPGITAEDLHISYGPQPDCHPTTWIPKSQSVGV